MGMHDKCGFWTLRRKEGMRVFEIAKYIYDRYKKEYGEKIDEMKLHKMLYFAQREAFILTGEALFKEEFSAWKYGPVMEEIRSAYKMCQFDDKTYDYTNVLTVELTQVMNKVFKDFAHKEAWSLSRISHGEKSWKNARKGVPDYENSSTKMKTEDIRIDAQNMKERRRVLKRLNLLHE